MEPADHPRPEPPSAGTSKRGLNSASLGLVIALAVLLVAIRIATFQSPRVELALWISLISAVVLFALSSADVLLHIHKTERQAKSVFGHAFCRLE